MSDIILYGAGRYLGENLSKFIRQGISPVCIADADPAKHYTYFCGEGQKLQVLPLTEAIRKYPDYKIYISVAAGNMADVIEYVKSQNLDNDRVFPAPGISWRLGCPSVGKAFVTFENNYTTCCAGGFTKISQLNNYHSDLEKYLVWCGELNEKLRNGEDTVCNGCSCLKYDYYEDEPLPDMIIFNTGFAGDRCNFKCCYCASHKMLSSVDDSGVSLAEYVQSIFDSGLKPNIMSLQNGEFSICKERGVVADLLIQNSQSCIFLTNAFVYSIEIEKLLLHGLVKLLNVSLDSGTPETFEKIKGLDCFDRVIGNLHKYAAVKAPLELKYVLLENINDNEVDIDGFADICLDLQCDVSISYDGFALRKELSDRTRELLARLILKARAGKLRVSLSVETIFSENDARYFNGLIKD